MKILLLSKLIALMLIGAGPVHAQSLKGSPTSIERQYQAARAYGLAFVSSARTVKQHIGPGQLVRVSPSRHLELHDVSYPYGVPATKTFLTRLSGQYHSACGEKLIVTSLLRPRDRQPRNSVAKSVHPTGMAIDLRVPRSGKCRSWLERVLLSLEGERVLDVTRERRPPHYHVALFVENYERRLGIQQGPHIQTASIPAGSLKYTVLRGDTLSDIASTLGVSVPRLRAANSLRANRIYAGQILHVPVLASAATASVKQPSASQKITSGNYTVRRGDSLSEIAAAAGVSRSRLAAVNGVRGSRIYAGQTLRIPGSEDAVAESVQRAKAAFSGGREYTVQRGDSLSEIASATGVSKGRLAAANGLRGYRIYAGQTLQIPVSGSALAAQGEVTHKVSRGDTLWRIANLYGTSVAQIRRVNRDAGDFLKVGQVLRIVSG
ncbi:MAG: LysM peptidoglycan-binding domain-containing protein [Proteobacteria bacterium]|nr:LysM peptidoglycan-binding domain-containing protein [Pseudomonadota bacterium]